MILTANDRALGATPADLLLSEADQRIRLLAGLAAALTRQVAELAAENAALHARLAN